jgi:hypothetical protein
VPGVPQDLSLATYCKAGFYPDFLDWTQVISPLIDLAFSGWRPVEGRVVKGQKKGKKNN